MRETSLHPSQIATPTRDSTDGVVNNPMHLSRPNKDVFRNLVSSLSCFCTLKTAMSFVFQVLKRDDYRCCVTGWNDHEKPNLDPGVTTTKRLSACHIVGRVVGFLDKGTQPHVTIDSVRTPQFFVASVDSFGPLAKSRSEHIRHYTRLFQYI